MIRQFDARQFGAEAIAGSKRGRRIAVCVPARDEEATIADVVGIVRRELVEAHAVVDELVVVDDGSTDRTAEAARRAGAIVVEAGDIERRDVEPGDVEPGDLAPGRATEHGKGQAMWRGVEVTTAELVVFCDADVRSFSPAYVLGLVGPLLAHEELQAVKGFYTRPLDGRAGQGGRVTELMARPVISMLFPHLGPLVQPLAGELAARRGALESVPFVGGYGVDLGLLIDLSERYGVGSLAQCDLGERVHRNRDLSELGAQALAILQVALQRSATTDARSSQRPWASELPWTTDLQQPGPRHVPVTMTERPPLRYHQRHRRPA